MEYKLKPELQRYSPAFIGLAAAALAVGVMTDRGPDTPPGPIYDVSAPQCASQGSSETEPLPEARSAAIVGLNGGRPLTVNSCVAEQVAWALDSAGDTDVPPAGIYVNASNPGKEFSVAWPTTGEYQGEPCDGSDSLACAYEYGESLAAWNMQKFNEVVGRPLDVEASDMPWWIDVEYGNSWQCNLGSALCGQKNALPVEAGAYGRNAAVVEGLAAGLESEGIEVGVYTHPDQWQAIVSNTVERLPERYPALQNAPAWIAGATSQAEAAEDCATIQPFGGLGRIVLSQFWNPGQQQYDQNVYCPPSN